MLIGPDHAAANTPVSSPVLPADAGVARAAELLARLESLHG